MKPAVSRAIKYSCVILYACVTMVISFLIAYYVVTNPFSIRGFIDDLLTLLLIDLIVVLVFLPLFNLLFTDLRSISLVEQYFL